MVILLLSLLSKNTRNENRQMCDDTYRVDLLFIFNSYKTRLLCVNTRDPQLNHHLAGLAYNISQLHGAVFQLVVSAERLAIYVFQGRKPLYSSPELR